MEKRDKTTPESAGPYDPFSVSVESMLGNAKLNQAALGPNAGLVGSNILFREDTVGGVRRRGWNERLFYGVGTTYLVGITAGSVWGFYEGLRHPDGTTARLRINSVLNSVTRRGPFLGNSLGVLAVMYHFADGGLERLRGTTDVYNNIAAGTIAGLVFKSSAGVRPAALAAVIGGAIVGLYSVVEELIENNTTNVFYS